MREWHHPFDVWWCDVKKGAFPICSRARSDKSKWAVADASSLAPVLSYLEVASLFRSKDSSGTQLASIPRIEWCVRCGRRCFMNADRNGPWETGAYAVVRWNSVPERSVVARVRRPPSAEIFVCATRVREASVDSFGVAVSMASYGMNMAVPPRSSALGAYEISTSMRK